MNQQEAQRKLEAVGAALQTSYADGFGVNRSGSDSLPSREEVVTVTAKLLELIFPGFDRSGTYPGPAVLLSEVLRELSDQIARAMRRIAGGKCRFCYECGSFRVCL